MRRGSFPPDCALPAARTRSFAPSGVPARHVGQRRALGARGEQERALLCSGQVHQRRRGDSNSRRGTSGQNYRSNGGRWTRRPRPRTRCEALHPAATCRPGVQVRAGAREGTGGLTGRPGALTCVSRLLGGTSGTGTSEAEPGLCPRGPHPRPREGRAGARSAKPPSADAAGTTSRRGRVSGGPDPALRGLPLWAESQET